MTTVLVTEPSEEQRVGAIALELRDVQAVGAGRPYTFLEGRAVPYDTPADLGWFLEQHHSERFKRSTKGNAGQRLPLLLFHDNRSFPVGHAEEWRHTDGLHGVWRLNDSPEAQRAAQAAEAGDLVGLSIGFMALRSEWDFAEDFAPELGAAHKDRVTRLESRLLEVSLTPTPAFVDAGVEAVRTGYGAHFRAAVKPAAPTAELDAWRAWRTELDSAGSD
jgi:HK97 family phage prohead protease